MYKLLVMSTTIVHFSLRSVMRCWRLFSELCLCQNHQQREQMLYFDLCLSIILVCVEHVHFHNVLNVLQCH